LWATAACERQPKRRQACDDVDVERPELVGQLSGQRIQHLEACLVDDQRGQGMRTIGKRAERQAQLAAVVQASRHRKR
jgi:hypothetical protein